MASGTLIVQSKAYWFRELIPSELFSSISQFLRERGNPTNFDIVFGSEYIDSLSSYSYYATIYVLE